MEREITDIDNAIVNDKKSYNKEIKPVPKPQENIGISNTNVSDDLIAATEAITNHTVDISTFNSFNQVATSRNQLYNVLDMMGQDSIITSILETYAEDATETNDEGKIVWAESNDPNVSKYTNFLLQALQIDKHAYPWIYSLLLYGDLYLELFKESEYNDDIFKTKKKNINNAKDILDNKQSLNEDLLVYKYADNDHYVNYLEAVANPAELFELTRFGKTAGYIETNNIATAVNTNQQSISGINGFTAMYQYNTKSNDIKLYDNDKFVHATLETGSNRAKEQVTLFKDDKNTDGVEYKVRKGQSLLYNAFKVWRELSLLENSILLNRVTKSAIVRMINVEVGDMPKENVGPHLQKVKSLMEQKSALDVGNSMEEYTNPGPIENNIYIPTYNGKGAVTTTQVGGDVNVGQLPDIEYYQNKFFGSMRIPKQYFGLTNDAAGFSGGESLARISSRYAKSVKRIQSAFLQAITTAINLLLIDKGLTSYVNKFTLKMQSPTTQEEVDRRDNVSSKVQIVRDVMDLVSDVEDTKTKLKILKSLLANVITDTEVIGLLEDEINKLEDQSEQPQTTGKSTESSSEEPAFGETTGLDLDKELGLETPEIIPGEEETEEEALPTPEELGIDMTDNNEEE